MIVDGSNDVWIDSVGAWVVNSFVAISLFDSVEFLMAWSNEDKVEVCNEGKDVVSFGFIESNVWFILTIVESLFNEWVVVVFGWES